MKRVIKTHRDLHVYQTALTAALALSRLAKKLPRDEAALKDQVRRVGRAPGAAVCEAWRKRGYPQFWKNKLTDAQSESGEGQWWLEIMFQEGYISEAEFLEHLNLLEKLIAQLAAMIGNPRAWLIK